MSETTATETPAVETAVAAKPDLQAIIEKTRAELAQKRERGELPPKPAKPSKEDKEAAKAVKKTEREKVKAEKAAAREVRKAEKAVARAAKKAAAAEAKAKSNVLETSDAVKEALEVLADLSNDELKTAVRLAKRARKPAKVADAAAALATALAAVTFVLFYVYSEENDVGDKREPNRADRSRQAACEPSDGRNERKKRCRRSSRIAFAVSEPAELREGPRGMSNPPSRVRTLAHGVATDEVNVPLALFISHPVSSRMVMTQGGMIPEQTKRELYVNVDKLPPELRARVLATLPGAS